MWKIDAVGAWCRYLQDELSNDATALQAWYDEFRAARWNLDRAIGGN
jgi:hypothetical protein